MRLIAPLTALALALPALAQQHDPALHQQHMAGAPAPTTAKDARQAVKFPAQMREHTLANMRDHLLALQEIQSALSRADYDRAADVAESRLGMTSLTLHGAHESAKFMPKGMQDAGTAMHRSASRFAVLPFAYAVFVSPSCAFTPSSSTCASYGAPHASQHHSGHAALMQISGMSSGKVAKWASRNEAGLIVQTERRLRCGFTGYPSPCSRGFCMLCGVCPGAPATFLCSVPTPRNARANVTSDVGSLTACWSYQYRACFVKWKMYSWARVQRSRTLSGMGAGLAQMIVSLHIQFARIIARLNISGMPISCFA